MPAKPEELLGLGKALLGKLQPVKRLECHQGKSICLCICLIPFCLPVTAEAHCLLSHD